MPIRQRLRRVFTNPSSSSGNGGANSSRATKTSASNVYLPHEIPPSKYRGPVDPAHKARMEGFSFAGTGIPRRNSGCSQYSPFGSRLPSRNTSRVPSRNNSIGRPPRDARKRYNVPGKSTVAQVTENADEVDDVTNVGASCRQTRNHSLSDLSSSVPSEATDDSVDTEAGDMQDLEVRHMPFTEADLQNALEKSLSKCSLTP